MELVVLLKQVPDLAEELEIDASGKDLARDWLSYVTSEWDEYALEEALQLRDLVGGTVTCLALDTGSVDELLATCLARGADRVIKVGSFERPPDSHTSAAAFAAALRTIGHDLVLIGVQAIDDLDGQVGPLLAAELGLPHVSVVTHIAIGARRQDRDRQPGVRRRRRRRVRGRPAGRARRPDLARGAPLRAGQPRAPADEDGHDRGGRRAGRRPAAGWSSSRCPSRRPAVTPR